MTLAELDARLDDLARRARAREYRLELALAELRGLQSINWHPPLRPIQTSRDWIDLPTDLLAPALNPAASPDVSGRLCRSPTSGSCASTT